MDTSPLPKLLNPDARKVTRNEFQSTAYLNYYYKDFSPFVKHRVQCLHESFQTVPCGVKVLDYGSGPVMLCTISAAAKASEIVFADYTENNRKCLRQWLNSEPDAFDWSPQFNYVVQDLEGKGEKEAREREDQVKKIVFLKHLGTLIKPGGSIFYYGVEGDEAIHYTVGDRNFPSVCVSQEKALRAFENAGFGNITIDPTPKFDQDYSFMFISGTRL